jgi:hypothetical protein
MLQYIVRPFLCLALSCVTAASAYGADLVPATDPVVGHSQEEWSKRWWQWALSFDQESSPVADTTGINCAKGQSGEVWFLAGTYGTRRTVRTCHVPQGKILFFPLINYITFPSEASRESCMSLLSRAARLTEVPSALVLEVNGRRFSGLEAHRQFSKGCFPLTRDAATLAAGNGYYVALKPLPPGTHTLNFGGILPTMSQAVSYTLVVE